MNKSLLFLSLLILSSISTSYDDLSFIKVNLPISDNNSTGINITIVDINTNNTASNSTATTVVDLTQPTEAVNLAMGILANSTIPMDTSSLTITNTSTATTEVATPVAQIENCKIDNDYAKKLSELDNEISNLRITFMGGIIGKIGKDEAFLLDPANDPHDLIQQYLLNFEVLQGKLNIFKSDVVLHNKAACGKIFFMLFNTENLLNNLYYLLESEKFELS
jgi:hypothetical protein